jgi:hypothetical protein
MVAVALYRCVCGGHGIVGRGCPLCGRRGASVRRAIAGAAGAAVFVASVGCAYGCPRDMCDDDPPEAGADTGRDAPNDVLAAPDASDDAALDVGVDAPHEAGDAALDGPTDAPGG